MNFPGWHLVQVWLVVSTHLERILVKWRHIFLIVVRVKINKYFKPPPSCLEWRGLAARHLNSGLDPVHSRRAGFKSLQEKSGPRPKIFQGIMEIFSCKSHLLKTCCASCYYLVVCNCCTSGVMTTSEVVAKGALIRAGQFLIAPDDLQEMAGNLNSF